MVCSLEVDVWDQMTVEMCDIRQSREHSVIRTCRSSNFGGLGFIGGDEKVCQGSSPHD